VSPKHRKQMLANQAKLTYERLREVLRYEPETGECTWLASTGKRKDLIGKRACSLDKVDGYRRIKVDGVSYLSSRLAVFFITELWPDDEVDHKTQTPVMTAGRTYGKRPNRSKTPTPEKGRAVDCPRACGETNAGVVLTRGSRSIASNATSAPTALQKQRTPPTLGQPRGYTASLRDCNDPQKRESGPPAKEGRSL